MSQKAREIVDGVAKYTFVCEGCQAEGELGVPMDEHGTFGCPEGCGATYIQTTDEVFGTRLTCVVCPVFEDETGA